VGFIRNNFFSENGYSTGALWEGPGGLSHCHCHCLAAISGPPVRKNFSSSFRVKNETRCVHIIIIACGAQGRGLILDKV
jgi:hypothetical protein